MATKVITTVDVAERKKLAIRAGDTVRVWQKIQEDKNKFRLQAFEGLVMSCKHGNEAGATFTVRKVVGGVGVERIFPLYSPMIDEIETVRRSKVRRAKLYFIQRKAAKEIRHKMRRVMAMREEELAAPEIETAPAQAEASKEAVVA